MKLVLAHAGDDEAVRIARELDARLMTPRALSQPGWRHYPVGGGTDTLFLDGEVIAASAIHGVVTRIAAVQLADLPHIREADRGYIAAEMTAFLLSFLGGLHCPVINRPTATSLMGPGWTPVRWRAAAHASGFACDADTTAAALVVVVGEHCFGAPDPSSEAAARALARLARVQLLGMQVAAGARFAGAHPWCHVDVAAMSALRTQLGEAA
jgi:hypothetical protein